MHHHPILQEAYAKQKMAERIQNAKTNRLLAQRRQKQVQAFITKVAQLSTLFPARRHASRPTSPHAQNSL